MIFKYLIKRLCGLELKYYVAIEQKQGFILEEQKIKNKRRDDNQTTERRQAFSNIYQSKFFHLVYRFHNY